ncbi:MAG: hypothetical protein KC435_02780 [Thermomicrobiales bacterium]|nr:hypothetical protein [Thermomicrobiales bacterium]
MLNEITNARCTIDINMYLLSDDVIIGALADAEERGVDVRVILERNPFNTYGSQNDVFVQLEGLGAEVIWSSGQFQYSHAKYMIVDNQVLVVTNQNFTGAGFNSNREFGIVTTDPAFVAQANAVFLADWLREDAVVGITSLIVSPVNARARIIELINGAEESVWLYAEVLRDEQFTQALDDAADRGVDVRVIVNPSTDDEDVPYFLDAFDHGVQIRVQEKPYVHAKLIIVDGTKALVGSQNYSYTSLDRNREIGMIVDDADSITRLTDVYLSDWVRAYPVDSVAISCIGSETYDP